MLKRFLSVSILVLLLSGYALGEISAVPENHPFSSDSVEFDFSGLAEGADVSGLLGKWGIRFVQGDGGVATLRVLFSSLGTANSVVRNVPITGSSSGKPIVIDFDHPVRRLSFRAGNASEGGTVEVRAFGARGESLGTVQQGGLGDAPVFVGLEDDGPGFVKLLISYGADEAPEQIDDLRVDFVDRPLFRTFLSQIGDGPLPGGSLRTTVIVSNLSGSTAEGVLEFFDSSGNPLSLDFEGGALSSLPLALPPVSSVSLSTLGTSDPVGVGYALIRSNVPVEGTAIFRVVSEAGVVQSEAGVGSVEGTVEAVGAVQKQVALEFDSGIALVNTGNRDAQGVIEAYDSSGKLVATNAGFLSQDFGPGQHKAAFLPQIFGELQGRDLDGTIKVVSNVPVAVVILRTSAGQVLSSLPVGSTEE